jgi:hypothetical protein
MKLGMVDLHQVLSNQFEFCLVQFNLRVPKWLNELYTYLLSHLTDFCGACYVTLLLYECFRGSLSLIHFKAHFTLDLNIFMSVSY